MGQRMFVAVVPPDSVREDLEAFLDARPGLRWSHPHQWHVTLAFFASVPEHRIDELGDRLATKASKRHTVTTALAGGGAFPNPARASVLWLGLDGGTEELTHLATSARAAGAKVGAPPDGTRFSPHLTVARLRPPIEATKWLRVLDSYRGPAWEVAEIELLASFLGEGPGGRPRYETVARFPLGRVGEGAAP